MSLFVNYRKVDFDLFCYILFSDPLSHISASQHCLTSYISCCSWSEFHLSPTHSLVTDREFHIVSLSSTGVLNMSCMNYRLPLVWYSISSRPLPVTDISILLILHHSSGMFAGSDDINTASFTHHNKRKSHGIMSSDLGCHEH